MSKLTIDMRDNDTYIKDDVKDITSTNNIFSKILEDS